MKKAFFLVFALLGTAIALAPQTSAASGFNAGRIIDDSVFTNKSSMSVSDIQSFLNSKVTACDTSGSQQSEMNNSGVPDYNGNGSIQRWEWGKYKYNQTTFPCLKDYKQDNVSAAQLIYNASQTYSINPQVLIVLLQKEQGLVTDTWPLDIQYRSATGYGCPDTAACDSKYYGLKNQIDWASKMFRSILDNSPNWYTPYVLGDNYIQYSPDSTCGGSTVNIQNRSTQALYNYTPYQPNQAALDAGWGTANCGAYGNRNFYLYFNSWFGATNTNFELFSDPRWMQLNTSTRKINALTGDPVDEQLASGQQIQFASKIYTGNEWCYRTEHDTRNGYNKCIPASRIDELTITYQDIAPEAQLMQVSINGSQKQNLRRGVKVEGPLEKTRQVRFTKKTTIGNVTYYISETDANRGNEQGVAAPNLTPSIAFELVEPVWLMTKETIQKIDIATRQTIDGELSAGLLRMYTSRVNISGQWYYRTETDRNGMLAKALPEASLQPVPYESFSSPRWMELRTEALYEKPGTSVSSGPELAAGSHLKFSSKIYIAGKWYYRTAEHTQSDSNLAIPADKIKEIEYTNFSSPRNLRLTQDTRKVIPTQDKLTGDQLYTGLIRKFNSKIFVNNQWYYRTETDTTNGFDGAIPANMLTDI